MKKALAAHNASAAAAAAGQGVGTPATQYHLRTLAEQLSDANNASVSAAFLNEKQIEADTKRLQAQLAIYQRQTRQWLALLDQFNSSLKARGSNMNADLAVLLHTLGDLENWSGVIERDMQEVALTLAKVAQPTAEGEPQDG